MAGWSPLHYAYLAGVSRGFVQEDVRCWGAQRTHLGGYEQYALLRTLMTERTKEPISSIAVLISIGAIVGCSFHKTILNALSSFTWYVWNSASASIKKCTIALYALGLLEWIFSVYCCFDWNVIGTNYVY